MYNLLAGRTRLLVNLGDELRPDGFHVAGRKHGSIHQSPSSHKKLLYGQLSNSVRRSRGYCYVL